MSNYSNESSGHGGSGGPPSDRLLEDIEALARGAEDPSLNDPEMIVLARDTQRLVHEVRRLRAKKGRASTVCNEPEHAFLSSSDFVRLHLIAMNPGDRAVGISPANVDVHVAIGDKDVFNCIGPEAEGEFVDSLRSLLSEWLDVEPRRIYTAEQLAQLEADDSLDEVGADPT